MTRRLLASLAARAAFRCRSTPVTNGDRSAIASGPPPDNRQPMAIAKRSVLPCGTTTADALSSGTRLKSLKRRTPVKPKLAGLGFTGSHYKVRGLDCGDRELASAGIHGAVGMPGAVTHRDQ